MNFCSVSTSAIVMIAVLSATPLVAQDPPRKVSMAGDRPGVLRDDNGPGMKLAWCPRGFVTMEQVNPEPPVAAVPDAGAADEELPPEPAQDKAAWERTTAVKVFLSQGYWIGQCEITQGDWLKVVASTPWKGQRFVKEDPASPVTYVTWMQAMEFCAKLTSDERSAGRLTDDWEYTLPTEAQWERSCRAQTDTLFSFGSDPARLDDFAWFWNNAWQGVDQFPRGVGLKRPNAWNIHDMHGNVWEWCRDSWSARLPGGRDPLVSSKDVRRVMRGGACCDLAELCHSSYRFGRGATSQNADLGFRVVLSPVRLKAD